MPKNWGSFNSFSFSFKGLRRGFGKIRCGIFKREVDTPIHIILTREQKKKKKVNLSLKFFTTPLCMKTDKQFPSKLNQKLSLPNQQQYL